MPEFRRVPSRPRLVVTDGGDVIGASGRQLRHFPDKNGYRRVNLYLGNREWVQLGVHFLVCEAFHGPRPEGAVVAHGDGDPGNNRADNLRWSTRWQNEHDKRRHGTALLGERHHRAKLTEAQVREIRASDAPSKQLAAEYGVTYRQIWSIRTRETWAHI